MPNKMLIDATHPEETRVVVLRGNRVEEFDFESANRKQLRGNIYLAKVTRVEPSLQAAFVDYGGNRHGFLAFGEIHPDYYQIPVADRQALIDEEERAARAAELEADHRAGRRAHRERRVARPRDEIKSAAIDGDAAESETNEPHEEIAAMAAASEVMAPPAGDLGEPASPLGDAITADADSEPPGHSEASWPEEETPVVETDAQSSSGSLAGSSPDFAEADELEPAGDDQAPIDLRRLEASAAVEPLPGHDDDPAAPAAEHVAGSDGELAPPSDNGGGANITEVSAAGGEEEPIESVGGADALEEVPERMSRMRRQYKIQEVIKRRQVMLVQVVKEERGTKGAALTTYLSLAGRYSVLMPNTARGGGISRKITDATDRKRLKEIAQELEVPEGMGVILRTAGASRTKTEVKRDFEYLLRLWETVRDLTLKSTAPTLVYEEGSLVKRSIRDLYNKDIDEILVAGEAAYQEARDFMRMLMPSHARNVRLYTEGPPIFSRFGIESQLDAMFQPVVQLRSGGYIVLNQAEALVAIDVNSGRATREHHIEDTALKTNVEASEEIARQLRLRDLAGLIVIDFIDMDEKRNNRTVERRLKDALKHDRARIQVGHISHFGLLEMSRQRIRSSVLESSTEKCPNCGGTGHIRSISSVSLQLLRAIEEMLLKGATHNLIVRTRSEIALYLLNHKRAHLRDLEQRFQLTITVNADPTVIGQLSYLIEKGEQVHSVEQAKALAAYHTTIAPVPEDEDEDVEANDEIESVEATEEDEEEDHEAGEGAEAAPAEGERSGRKRRRRRRGRRGEPREGDASATEPGSELAAEHDAPALAAADDEADHEDLLAANGETEAGHAGSESHGETAAEGERRRRRRGRRGGRRNRQGPGREGEAAPEHAAAGFNGAAGEDTADTAAEAGPGHDADPDYAHQDYTNQDDAHQGYARGDTEASPQREPGPQPESQYGPQHEPAPQAAVIEHSYAAHPDASPPPEPRRGSTVREPAPTRPGGDFAPPAPHVEQPEPVVSSTSESESDSGPRRSGWWSRRFGNKG